MSVNRDYHTILPGMGIADLRLGMTKDQVRGKMGPPEEIDSEEFPDGSESITFFYPAAGLSFDFGSDNDYVLDTIRVEHSDIQLFDQVISGLSVKEALALFESQSHLPEADPFAFVDDDGNKVRAYDFDSLSLTVWFLNDALQFVQIGTFWKDDETPLFPEG